MTIRRRGAHRRRRALELLAASPDGCTEAVMLAHGFSINHVRPSACRFHSGEWKSNDPTR
jgi:hypothetical protein